ncbi:MAG: response regulator [Vicinamibacterales bacterium]
MARILLVDDDDQFRGMMETMLHRMGHDVVSARSVGEALRECGQHDLDLLITDLIMPDRDGLELIRDLRREGATLPILAMTGGGRTKPAMYLKMAASLGAQRVLAKPFTFAELTDAIAGALQPQSG